MEPPTTGSGIDPRNGGNNPNTMNSKAKSMGMRCLGAITILAGQRVVYYAASDGALWQTFDGMELTACAGLHFGPKTEAEAVEYIRERQ